MRNERRGNLPGPDLVFLCGGILHVLSRQGGLYFQEIAADFAIVAQLRADFAKALAATAERLNRSYLPRNDRKNMIQAVFGQALVTITPHNRISNLGLHFSRMRAARDKFFMAKMKDAEKCKKSRATKTLSLQYVEKIPRY